MNVEEITNHILSLFTRFKHIGFREEREVRAAVFPMTKATETKIKQLDPNYTRPDIPMKKILQRDDIPYIELFDLEKNRLPIKRIIIGPQKDQKSAREDLVGLLGAAKIDIHCSETPLVKFGN